LKGTVQPSRGWGGGEKGWEPKNLEEKCTTDKERIRTSKRNIVGNAIGENLEMEYG